MVAHRIFSLFLLMIATYPATILCWVFSLTVSISNNLSPFFKRPMLTISLVYIDKKCYKKLFFKKFLSLCLQGLTSTNSFKSSVGGDSLPPLEDFFTDSLFQTFNLFWLWSATLFKVARSRSSREKASLIILT